MGSSAKTSHNRFTDVYAAFRRLAPKKRRDVALRILKDEKVHSDLYDHLLIKRAMNEPGAGIPWRNGRNGH